jgi:hypothetical protein
MDTEGIKSLLALLRPDNMQLLVVDKRNEALEGLVEESVYGTVYKTEPFTPELVRVCERVLDRVHVCGCVCVCVCVCVTMAACAHVARARAAIECVSGCDRVGGVWLQSCAHASARACLRSLTFVPTLVLADSIARTQLDFVLRLFLFSWLVGKKPRLLGVPQTPHFTCQSQTSLSRLTLS